jgi:hypothetical protein
MIVARPGFARAPSRGAGRRPADRLSRERMAVEVEAFAAALAGDLIDADDFAP